MTLDLAAIIELDIEKPAAGGRMLARHHGQVVLVAGCIPGERVHARVERVGKGVAYADTVDVVDASADRRPGAIDWRCGGNAFAHIAYARQPLLKAQIIQDAFTRIARMPLVEPPSVVASPENGYRMRARLHAKDGRLGFFREGTHDLCDAAQTGQLLPATAAWLAGVADTLRDAGLTTLAGLEVAENVAGDQRACHLDLHAGADATPFRALSLGLTGLSAQTVDRRDVIVLSGDPAVTDDLRPGGDAAAPALALRRDVRAFFQGNRFLLEPLVRHVVTSSADAASAEALSDRPVIDLYAGVGLFGLALAVAGAPRVTLVEGDPVSAEDLTGNARPYGARAQVERRSVEAFLGSTRVPGKDHVCVVDPPRTGMSREALNGLIRLRPARIVYVSCDVATLARDTRVLVDAGYQLGGLTGFDLFPNTAHVETVAVFGR